MSVKLTDAQLVMMSAAAQRKDRCLSAPAPIKGAALRKISAIRAESWEAINRTLLASARQEKVETGKVVRVDSTVTAALCLNQATAAFSGMRSACWCGC